MLRLGVIGYGSRINDFFEALNEVGDVELAAVTDIVDKTEFLEENGHKNVKLYTDADEMLQKEKLDGVCIGTRCSLHSSYMKLIE